MTVSLDRQLVYPDSDGQPMADNTQQFRWIVLLKENLECLFAQNPDVFVAGDLLWYPVEGHPEIRVAPDAMVVLGRPKVEEYYLYNPDRNDLTGFHRVNDHLEVIEEMAGWTSPRLGIVFTLTDVDLEIYYPDGRRFLTTVELAQQAEQEQQRAEQEKQRAEQEKQRAEQEKQRAEQEKQRAEQEKQRADRLAAQLRALGVEPD